MAATPGKGSKAKGGAGEREVVQLFRAHGFEAERSPYSGANKAWPGDVIGPPGLHIEVKRQENARYPEWFRQAERDRQPGKMPIVLHRKNNGQWMVYCRLDHFLQLYKRVARREGGGSS